MKNTLFLASLLLGSPVLAQTFNPNIENITPDSRYTVNNDGTVTDNETGLMWMQCSEGQTWESNGGAGGCIGTATSHTWEAALALANAKAFAGYTDWRLPNIKELASLVAEDRYDPAINSKIFPETPYPFWSGSPNSNSNGDSWIVNFYYGRDDNEINRYNSPNYPTPHVRLVRSAQ